MRRQSYWWDGGFEVEVHWGLPAAPLPSAALDKVSQILWAGAVPAGEGLMRPETHALLVHRAVQVCRPSREPQRAWEGFLGLLPEIGDATPAGEIARRAGVSAALRRALAAAAAGGGPPGPGSLYGGLLWPAWWLAGTIQRHAPKRLKHLLAGEPSLGDTTIRCRFGDVDVLAGPGVFVPTADADIFIEMATERLQGVRNPVVMELGTGCGPIALALGRALPNAEVHAADLSSTAIRWARKSGRLNGLDRVHFYTGPLLEPVPNRLRGRVDLIAANLPFYPARDFASIGSVPRDTIQGEDDDGLGLLRQLARYAPQFLRPGGTMILQMFSSQWPVLSAELTEHGFRPATPRVTGPFAICPAELLHGGAHPPP
jgi:release factor glutamine methyltransferase